ncbi:MAG TPA: hypothetical protein VFF73_02260 [Planctomycetota bacterium]|nr:hypothetical protein [Planctomycetota bacterium]
MKARRDRGQGLVEYGFVVAGVALVGALGVSEVGHKTAGLVGAMKVVLPGAHFDCNSTIVTGRLIEEKFDPTHGAVAMDVNGIVAASGTDRLGVNLAGAGTDAAAYGLGGLVIESR